MIPQQRLQGWEETGLAFAKVPLSQSEHGANWQQPSRLCCSWPRICTVTQSTAEMLSKIKAQTTAQNSMKEELTPE